MRRSIAGCLLVLLVAVAGCSGVNMKTHSFATLAEADQAGAIQQGWVPAGLPPGARDIRAAYVPGESEHWGLFDFPPAQAGVLEGLLGAEVPLEGLRLDVPGRLEWWPVAMRGQVDAERLGITGLKAYRTRDGGRFVAVNWNQGRAYYWRS